MKDFNGKKVLIGLIAVLLGLIAGGLLMLISGDNPFSGYAFLFRGGLMNLERIGNTLATATPLIFTGLAVAFAFRTGLFNIGASGQMLMGGFAAIAVGIGLNVYAGLNLPQPVLLLLTLSAAFLAGALWAAVPGILKAFFNVHEVVATIMMNWIAYWTVYYLVPTWFKGEFLETESMKIPEAASLKVAWLTNLFSGSYINLGIFIALGGILAISLILNKSTLGFQLKAVGFNRHGAEYAGIQVNKNIALSMMISGALAGLGGATLYTGYASSIQIGVLPTHGFDGIAVALLGANSPLGVLLAALFFGILHSGKGFMNASTNIPPEVGDTIIAVIIYFAAVSILIERLLNFFAEKRKGKI